MVRMSTVIVSYSARDRNVLYTITDRSIETLGLFTVSGAKAVLENECRPREEGR